MFCGKLIRLRMLNEYLIPIFDINNMNLEEEGERQYQKHIKQTNKWD